jgi:hypothetical protein
MALFVLLTLRGIGLDGRHPADRAAEEDGDGGDAVGGGRGGPDGPAADA